MRRNKVVSLFAVGALALGLAACSSDDKAADGAAGTTTFKVAFNQNAAHPQAKALAEISDKLKEATDGKYALEVFHDELLGSQAETLEMVQTGTVQMAIVGGSLLENFNPDFSVVNLPYLFDSIEHQMKVLNDPAITGELYSSIEDKGIKVLVSYHAGVRNVYTKTGPITKPEDLKGMKIRVIGSDTNVRMMELMGGVGTPMAQGEVYTAIQSGVLDGGENNELIYSDLAHAEIAPYYAYTKHLMMPDTLVINPKVLADMDDTSRAKLLELVNASVDTEVKLFAEAVTDRKAKAEAAGAKFNDVDFDAFRNAVLPLHQERLTTDVTKKIYEQIQAAR